MNTTSEGQSLDGRALFSAAADVCLEAERACNALPPEAGEEGACPTVIQDCADACGATGRILARNPPAAVARAAVRLAIEACRATLRVCDGGERWDEVLEACSTCERELRELLDSFIGEPASSARH